MTLNEGPIPRIVTAGDGTWTELAITDAKFKAVATDPLRYRREGNVVRLAGAIHRETEEGEGALADHFATLPEAVRPGVERETPPPQLFFTLAFTEGVELEPHLFQISMGEASAGWLSFQALEVPAHGTDIHFDGITWTVD